MKDKKLQDAQDNATKMLIDTLAEYVKKHGEDCTDYEIDVFGLQDEGRVTKVLNIYDNGGCYFFEPAGHMFFGQTVCHAMDALENLNDDNYYDTLIEHCTFTAYQCLYIVVDGQGNEKLKYYRLVNGGVKFDDDQCDPDHDDADKLPLLDLQYLYEAILHNKNI